MILESGAVVGIAQMRVLLEQAGRLDHRAVLRLVPGGVSSVVVAVHDPTGSWVAKTPLPRLAVADEWYADRARGQREAAVLELLDGRVGPLRTPRLRFSDAGRAVIGMELIAPPAAPWKDRLLAGEVDPGVAGLIGGALGALHHMGPAAVPAGLGGPADAGHYEAVRVDPYYRTAARRAPQLAAGLGRLIADTTGPDLDRCLVHADLNPKNVLVAPDGPVVIDWELAHVGDPAFDVAMPMAHLVLKSLRRAAGRRARDGLLAAAGALWDSYRGPARPDLVARHLGGIVAARLWGKSPVGYLRAPAERRAAAAVAAAALEGRDGVTAVLARARAAGQPSG